MDKSFGMMEDNKAFLVTMAVGSIAGALLRGLLLGIVPAVLLPLLAGVLVLSSGPHSGWRIETADGC